MQDPQYHGTARTTAAYLEESIRQPSAFIVSGGVYASPEHVSFMPDTYDKTRKPEEVTELHAAVMDLVAMTLPP